MRRLPYGPARRLPSEPEVAAVDPTRAFRAPNGWFNHLPGAVLQYLCAALQALPQRSGLTIPLVEDSFHHCRSAEVPVPRMMERIHDLPGASHAPPIACPRAG